MGGILEHIVLRHAQRGNNTAQDLPVRVLRAQMAFNGD
jgi:hypothetical protein